MPHPNPTWLDQIRHKRRVLRDIKWYEDPDHIFSMIHSGPLWPYQINREFYRLRDRALLTLIYLTAGRVNEVLRIRKAQFDFADPDFIVIKDFEISKRKEKTIKSEGIPQGRPTTPQGWGL